MKQFHQINATSIKEGTRFSAPVYFDDAINMFIAEGKPIKSMHLKTIKRWNISVLVTEGRVLAENEELPKEDLIEEIEEIEDIDDIQEFENVKNAEDVKLVDPADKPKDVEEYDATTDIDPVLEIREMDKVVDALPECILEYAPAKALVGYYVEVVAQMTLCFTEYKTNQDIQRAVLVNVTKRIMSMLEDKKNGAMSFILNASGHKNLAYSAVNVAIMSAIMAEQLNIPQRKISQVIAAALLHDIGMLFVSPTIVNKKDRLTNEEFEILKLHTVNASRLITEKLMLPREVGLYVQQHHESFDGSGYPEGRQGENIELVARIIAVADAFEAMTTEKSYRNEMIGNEAVKKLLDDNGTRFDPTVIKAFIQTMGIYPVGSLVMLNDLSVARVIETEVDAPFLPVIKLLNVPKKTTSVKKGDTFHLKSQRAFFIIRAVDPKEIAELI